MTAVLFMLLSMLPIQTSVTQLYRHSQCGFSFEYPEDWQIVKVPDDECAASLRRASNGRGRAPQDAELYTLIIQVFERSFLQVAGDNGFDFDGQWLVGGRQGSSSEAEIKNSGGWLVLRGVATAGCDAGGQTVLCDEYRVIAKHKDDDRVVSIVGGAQTEAALELVLRTLKLSVR
jgi:hypothetical protein